MDTKPSDIHARDKRAGESHFDSISTMYQLYQWVGSCCLLTLTSHHSKQYWLLNQFFVVTKTWTINIWLCLFHVFPVDSNSSSNSTNYVIQAVVNISDQDLLSLKSLLSTLSFPITISSVAVTSIDTTTGRTSFSLFAKVKYIPAVKISLNLGIVSYCLFIQCVHQMWLDTSADVNRTLLGHITAALRMGPVMPSLITHVDALMPFQLTSSTAS